MGCGGSTQNAAPTSPIKEMSIPSKTLEGKENNRPMQKEVTQPLFETAKEIKVTSHKSETINNSGSNLKMDEPSASDKSVAKSEVVKTEYSNTSTDVSTIAASFRSKPSVVSWLPQYRSTRAEKSSACIILKSAPVTDPARFRNLPSVISWMPQAKQSANHLVRPSPSYSNLPSVVSWTLPRVIVQRVVVHRVVLIRHGESQWNSENRFTGWADVPLSERGEDESHRAARALRAAGFSFDVVYTSVLKRAIKTAANILEGTLATGVAGSGCGATNLPQGVSITYGLTSATATTTDTGLPVILSFPRVNVFNNLSD